MDSVKFYDISHFFIGGVPESAEVKILGPLKFNKGFTGCIELHTATVTLSKVQGSGADKNEVSVSS